MVQLPSAARLNANSKPSCAAASCTFCSTQPASTVIVRFATSMLRTRCIRPQAQHDLRAAGVGHGAADQAGVAALRDDRGSVLAAQADDARHLVGRRGAHDGKGLAGESFAPVDLVGSEIAFGEDVAGADRRAQGIEERAHDGIAVAPRRRARMCRPQAANTIRASATSSPASQAPAPRSLLARTRPSATYSQTSRLSQR